MGLVIPPHQGMVRMKLDELLDGKTHSGPRTLSIFNKGDCGTPDAMFIHFSRPKVFFLPSLVSLLRIFSHG